MSTTAPVTWRVLPACMGGWCGIRERCPHYAAGHASRTPAERLCMPEFDGVGADIAVRITLPAGSWERKHAALLRPAGVFDGLVSA